MLLFTLFLLAQAGQEVAASPLQEPLQEPLLPQDHSQGYEFNPLLHLPGTSPYFDALGFGLKHEVPEGCRVVAASYLVRHGAIYSNDDEYEEYIKPFLWKLEEHRGGWSGKLEFLNTWQSPILEDALEELTPSGKVDARSVGRHLVKRYPHLVNTTQRVLADKKNRCYDTAKSFIEDFPNSESIEVVKLKKPKDGSIDPTIPHKTCNAFTKDPGTKEMAKFASHFCPLAARRLKPNTPPGLDLSDHDIIAMQSICGYESAIKGTKSPICDIFTDNEWMSYEYAWDMKYAHMTGPLNKLSYYLGYPWLQAQTDIFTAIETNDTVPGSGWPSDQRFFLYFTHREVPPFIATVLGIFNSTFEETSPFPTDQVVWTRAWKMSDLIPFLGHVGLEKMNCDNRPGSPGDYVRVIANTAPRPMPHCQDGPGASCKFEAFRDIMKDHGETYGNYRKVCKNGKEKKGKGNGKVRKVEVDDDEL